MGKNRKNKISKRKRREQLIHAQQRKEKMCSKKKGYPTEVEALAYGKISNDIAGRTDRKFYTYLCRYCNKFHLTTQPRRTRETA